MSRWPALGITLFTLGLASCTEQGFVQVKEGRFELDGAVHCFVGVNFWYGMHLGMAGPDGDRARLRAELDRLHGLGVTNVRVMAASEGPNDQPYRVTPALMIAPGEYDDRVLDGLDYLVAEIAERQMHAVVALNNFWEWSGGMAQYVCWYEGTEIPYPRDVSYEAFMAYAAKFYEMPKCQEWYRAHIAKIVTRVNPYTGRAYREEPAIFAWELANEPREYPMVWIEDTARYIKSLDPRHLVTTGSEGRVGGDFVSTHRPVEIDYATVHIWPQNWRWFDPQKPATYAEAEQRSVSYLREHAGQAAELGKPLVLEEFGMARDAGSSGDCYDPRCPTTHRDCFFGAMFGEVLDSVEGKGSISGSNIWAWGGRGRPGQGWIGDPPHEPPGWYSVFDCDDSTLAVIAEHGKALGRVLP